MLIPKRKLWLPSRRSLILGGAAVLAKPALAQLTMSGVGGGFGPAGGGGGGATRTYVTRVQSTVANTNFTFNATNIGTAAANRKTVLGVSAITQGGGGSGFNGATIGGVAAALQVEQVGTPDTSGAFAQTAIFSLDNPTGASANIFIDIGDNSFDCVVFVYAVYGAAAGNAAQTAASAVSPANLNDNIAAGGVGVGCVTSYTHAVPATTWVGYTEDNSTSLYGDDERSAASVESVSGGSPLTITATLPAYSTSNQSSAVVSAIFNP